jgi:hypothetical protein
MNIVSKQNIKHHLMKSYINKIVWSLALVATLFGCKKEESLRDTKVTAVETLYEPNDGKSVVLQKSASATLYFEWEAAKAEDAGMVLYEVAFDKEGGDFSKPIYKMASDNNGGFNYATITHKQINKIAALAGVESGATGKLIWTVFSSKGINEVKCAQSRTLEVTRLSGFAEIPVDVYVMGEGSEAGTDLANAISAKSTAAGEFEIYTKLTAGQPYYFTDAKTGSPRKFYITDGLLKEGTTTSTVAKTGVYRINLDFNVGSAVFTEITNMQLFFCPTNSFLFSMPYNGKGTFRATAQPITFKQEGWGRDERYKFKMTTITSDGNTVEEWWGTPNIDNRPTSQSPASYYYLFPAKGDQWSDKFKFDTEMDNALVDVTAYFQADKPYTHEVVKVGNQ